MSSSISSLASPSQVTTAKPRSWQNGMPAVFGIAAASFLLHMIFNNRYGYFRDEFDYIICGWHLAWGYVDQPPLVPLLSRVFLAIFGDSLRAVRLMPVLAISATIILSGMIASNPAGRS